MAIEKQEATETLLYNFDYPMVTESGAVKISDNHVILQFPEKPTVYVEDSIKVLRNITLYIENSHCFSLDWIPMHTWTDYYRVKDMIEKCLQSYSNLIGKTNFLPHTFLCNPIRYHESLTTGFTNNTFSLSCFEHTLDTCIQLSVNNKEYDEKEIPLHFQICIGKHVVFCTERDLKCVTQARNVHFIVQFILQKLLNFSLL
jgi:hypothetical protein